MKYLKNIIVALATITFLFACGENAEQAQTPFATESTAEKGGKLFKSKCAMCHSMNTDIAGPALKGVLTRWENDTVQVKAFIRNSQEVIKSGNPHAVATYEKYKTTMPTFPSFTDEEMSQLIAFLKD